MKKNNQNPSLSFSSTVVLNSKSNGRNQLIYGSQSYQTFYCIYANFDIATEGDQIVINNISYNLINYKGTLNMGFVETPTISYDSGKGIITIDVSVKGFSKEQTAEQSNIGLVVDNNCFELVVSRMLVPLNGKTKPTPFYKGLFDSEFFYRDGAFIKLRPDYGSMTDSDDVEDVRNLGMPGPRCEEGISEIII